MGSQDLPQPSSTSCSLGEPGFLPQAGAWREQSHLGWFLLGHSRRPALGSPGTGGQGLSKGWAEGVHLEGPEVQLIHPYLQETVGHLRTLGPARSWFDVGLGVGSVTDHPAQTSSGLFKTNRLATTGHTDADPSWAQTFRAPHASPQ